MRFSPSSVAPEQLVATTPRMFVNDPYGKLYDINGDGELIINQAIRMSKLINKFVPAFSGMDNRIIRGFRIEELYLDNNDLKIVLSAGSGAIGRNVFKMPLRIELVWKQFVLKIPNNVSGGRILLFFEFTDEIIDPKGRSEEISTVVENINNNYYADVTANPIKEIEKKNPLRPLPQNYIGPSNGGVVKRNEFPAVNYKYPLDQYEYSPIKITANLYNPATEKTIPLVGETAGSEWDLNSEKILITSAISFKVLVPRSSVEVFFDRDDRDSVIVNGGKFVQQNCGYLSRSIGTIDGGMIDSSSYIVSNKKTKYVEQYINKVIIQPREDIYLGATPSSLNNLYLFYNGKLLFPGTDYTIGTGTKITFSDIAPAYGDKIYAFENLTDVESGCLKNRLRSSVSTSSKYLEVSGISSTSDVLVFYDDEFVFPDNYTVENNRIQFISELGVGKKIDVLEVVKSPLTDLDILFSGSSVFTSNYVRVKGVRTDGSYLVFYDGELMLENKDYTLQKNVIVFANGIILDVTKKLFVLRV